MNFKIDPRITTSPSNLSSKPVVDKKSQNLEKLQETCKEFESLFVMEMFKAMRKAVPEGGLFEKNNATEIFTEMMDMETAKATTEGQGLGIAEAMYRQMAELVEGKK